MQPEPVPLSEAKTHLNRLVRRAEDGDILLMRHGRPVGALIGYRRYRTLVDEAERARRSAPARSSALLDALRDQIAETCRAHGVRTLAVFGSASRGEDEAESDLDLLVEFEPMSPGDRADAFFGLQVDLERLLRRRVDLLEESAITNPYLEEAISRDRTVVYAVA
jgi:prevent-host-death family protein